MLNKSVDSSVKSWSSSILFSCEYRNVYIKNQLSQKFDDSEGRLLRFVG